MKTNQVSEISRREKNRTLNPNHISEVFSPPIVDVARIVKNSPRKKDLISFGQGIPFYNPPEYALNVLKDKMNTHENYVHRYTVDEGLPDVLELILKNRAKKGFTNLSRENVILTAGANLAVYLALTNITSFGDEVIIPTPFYFNHVMGVEILQCKPVLVPRLPDLNLDLESIEKNITPKTKAIIITSPDNPTGAIYSRETLKKIYELAEKHNFWIIHDETYEEFIYDKSKNPHVSMQEFEKDEPSRVISVYSFSKVFGMSGYRAGYLIFPSFLYRNFLKLQDTIIVNCPVFSQILVKTMLEREDQTKDWFAKNFDQLRQVRKYILEEISDSEFFALDRSSLSGLGGFYLFPSIIDSKYQDNSLSLITKLIQEEDLVLLPGFGFGNTWNNYVRISFGNVNLEQVQEGFSRLKKFFYNS